MKLNELLEHAAWLLEKEAKAVKGSCRVGGQEWACPDCVDKLKCGSRMDYDDFTDTAKELRQHHVTAELMASDERPSARTFEEWFLALYIERGFVSSKKELQEAWDAASASAPSSLAHNEIPRDILEYCLESAMMLRKRLEIAPNSPEYRRVCEVQTALENALTPAATERIEPQNLRLKRELDEALAQRDYWKRTAESVPSASGNNQRESAPNPPSTRGGEAGLCGAREARTTAADPHQSELASPTSGTRMSDVERALWLADKLVGDYGSEAAQLLRKFASSARERIDLSKYVNAAGINAPDMPHTVVEKLQRAIDMDKA